jgi:hypothetical protein
LYYDLLLKPIDYFFCSTPLFQRKEQLHQLKEKAIQRNAFNKEGIRQHEVASDRHKKAIDESKD